MPANSKSSRGYDSPHRREQAEETRQKIVTAAQALFEREGYPATSMAAIAKAAGVSLKTVYLAFESKSGLLRALWNLQLRGEEGQGPVAERPWYREVLDEPDPELQLLLLARNSRAAKQRIGALLEVIRGAAPVDPEIGALWERISSDFRANQRAIVVSLDEKRALAPGLDVDRATDVLWALNLSNLWQLLVEERGWTAEHYENLLADSFRAALLASRDER